MVDGIAPFPTTAATRRGTEGDGGMRMVVRTQGLYVAVLFVVLTVAWLAVNVGAFLLIGWLGTLTVNLILATSYPWYFGPTILVVVWLMSGWIRWKRN